MKIFTHEEFEPSQKTLKFILEFAHSYRVANINGRNEVYCLN